MCNSTAQVARAKLNRGQRETIGSALRSRGLRLTTQREAVCEAVFNCPGHICAEHILESVSAGYPSLRVNKTTVYRTLDLLMDLNLVGEHKCGDGRAQYEPASRGQHSHLICRECGSLIDMEPGLADGLKDALKAQYGFQAELDRYPLFGLCQACRC